VPLLLLFAGSYAGGMALANFCFRWDKALLVVGELSHFIG
jgi:hypothetical protein